MKALKHIGRVISNGTKVLVAFRTLPGESNMALVIPVPQLSDSYHDSLMDAVESIQAQDAFEFGEVLFVRSFADGKPMLQALRADGVLQKVPTDNILMTPNPTDTIPLHQLNVLIAEQKNCAIDELCTFVSGAPKNSPVSEQPTPGKDIGEPNSVPLKESKVPPLKANENEVLSDQDIAKSYRSQADAMYKEAARLRKEADSLDPPKKKATKVSEEASA